MRGLSIKSAAAADTQLNTVSVPGNFLFDIAHSIGQADAKSFFLKMKVDDPIERLSAGPIHFAYSGWASVKIHPLSRPTPDENFYLIYDHPYSFEAQAWMEQKEKNDRETVLTNIRQSILPYLTELAQTNPSHGQQVLLDRLEKDIGQITSPLIGKLSSRYLNLTPMEIKVATLVKDGIVNKDIAQILKVSLNTITSHRYKIRTKLALKHKNINLRSYLLSLENA